MSLPSPNMPQTQYPIHDVPGALRYFKWSEMGWNRTFPTPTPKARTYTRTVSGARGEEAEIDVWVMRRLELEEQGGEKKSKTPEEKEEGER